MRHACRPQSLIKRELQELSSERKVSVFVNCKIYGGIGDQPAQG